MVECPQVTQNDFCGVPHIKYSLITLFLSQFLFGCIESNDKTVSFKPQSKEDIVQDSLENLDSLVFKYIAKNANESIKYVKQAVKVAQTVNTPASRAKAYKILGNAYSVTVIDSALRFSIPINDFSTMSNSLNSWGVFIITSERKSLHE